MMLRPAAEAGLLAGLLALFLCRAVVAAAVVPPWQGPDEPTHFALAYGLTMPFEMQRPVQGGVLQSMVRHGWWALYEDPPPDPLPQSFDRINGIGEGTLAQPLYYGAAAAILRVSRPGDLERAYIHLRIFSIVLAIATLSFGWAGTRRLLGAEIAAGATAVAALHPQFLLAAISVNADALLNLCGAFVWWQAVRVATGQHRDFSIVLMFVGAMAGLFTKRIGMVLVGIAFAVSAWSVWTTRVWTTRNATVAAAAGIVGAALLLAAALVFGRPDIWGAFWMNALTVRRPIESATLQEGFRFLRMTVDYFWLIGGWLRFQPPETWIWIARAVILCGFAGAAVVTIESPADRRLLALAWLFVGAQVAAMLYGVFWTIPSAPQARYLFPVFAPITALLYVGLRRGSPAALRPYWPAALVLLLAALDITGFTTVHIPTYLR